MAFQAVTSLKLSMGEMPMPRFNGPQGCARQASARRSGQK